MVVGTTGGGTTTIITFFTVFNRRSSRGGRRLIGAAKSTRISIGVVLRVFVFQVSIK